MMIFTAAISRVSRQYVQVLTVNLLTGLSKENQFVRCALQA